MESRAGTQGVQVGSLHLHCNFSQLWFFHGMPAEPLLCFDCCRRVLLSPFYFGFVRFALRALFFSKGLLWITVYLIASFVSLVPSTLLEGRYFTVGVVVAVLNTSKVGVVVLNTQVLWWQFGAVVFNYVYFVFCIFVQLLLSWLLFFFGLHLFMSTA